MNFLIILILIVATIFVIGLIIAGTASKNFYKVCSKYNDFHNSTGLCGGHFVQRCYGILKQNTEVYYTNQENAVDCYIPSEDKIVLTKDTYFSDSIVSIAIASHEMGHSIQKHKKSLLMFIINILQTLNKLLGGIFLPMVIIGLLVYIIPFEYHNIGLNFVYVGLISFLVGFLLKLLLIPLEYDASKRAQKFIKMNIYLSKKEFTTIKKIHKAALKTYVGSLFVKPYIFLYKIFSK